MKTYRVLIAALCVLAANSPVWCNGNEGRWWWDTAIGIGRQNTKNTIGGVKTIGYDQQDLRISLGLNGYIVHPTMAGFRIDTDWFLTKIDGGNDLDTDRIGLGAELNVLPRSAYPFSLFYRRKHFDYSGLGNDPVSVLRGAPDISTRWGGRMRFRKGAVKGTLLGFEHTGLDFMDPEARQEVDDRQFVDWARPGDSSRHRVRLERRYHEFGTVDLNTDDLTLRVEERRSFTPEWLWELNGDGIRRETTTSTRPAWNVNDYRITNRLRGDLRQQDILDIILALGLTEHSSAPSTDAQRGAVFYRWRRSPAWEIAPFVQYDRQSQDDRSLSSPRAGISASWNGGGPGFDTQVSAQTSFGTIRDQDDDGTVKDRRLAYGMTASFAHGDPGSLRKSAELEWSLNEFRVRRERVAGLPDLGLSGTNLGSDDFYRARFDLSRAYDSRSIRGWGEWSHQSGTRDVFGSGQDRDTWRGGAQWSARNINLQGDAGHTTLQQTSLTAEQRIKFATVMATWRPLRYLSFQAMYRLDQRRFDTYSNIDGTNIEAKMVLKFGLLSLDTSIIERTEDPLNGDTRKNRTIRWSLTSRFGGWLPFVNGTKRRGVIR